MNKIFKKFSLAFLGAAMVFSLQTFNTKAYAAEVGEVLGAPEEGWQRVDDCNKLVEFNDAWECATGLDTKTGFEGTLHNTKINVAGGKFTFKFKGTKFRVIGARNNSTYFGSQDISVNVDGKDYDKMSCFGNLTFECMLYDLEGLENDIHTVTVTNNTAYYMWFDAIDIDKDGSMLDLNKNYVNSVNLNKDSLVMNEGENETLTSSVMPSEAEDKNLTWTSSDPKVCTVDENGKVTAVGLGKAVVTATAHDGSGKAAVCNVNVAGARRAMLSISMNNGKLYTYNLSMPEIKAFDAWYMNRAKGEGSPFYKLTLENGDVLTVNYDSISEYLVHQL